MQFLSTIGKSVIKYYLPVLVMDDTYMPIIKPIARIIWVNRDQVEPWWTLLVLWSNWKDFGQKRPVGRVRLEPRASIVNWHLFDAEAWAS